MFKIGDFSKLCRVPVSALRYYADIGLLEPAHTDRFTSYRYYSLDQLPRLNRILALKDLGLSLEQIKQVLNEDLPASEVRGMLRLKEAELEQEFEEVQMRLKRVKARLMLIEQENTIMSQPEVVLKSLEKMTGLSLREVVPTPSSVGTLMGEMFGTVMGHQVPVTGTPFAIFHDGEFKPQDMDVEIVFPVAPGTKITLDMERGPKITTREFSTIDSAACIIHTGPYETLEQTYTVIGKWIEANGYQISGPSREVYLRPPGEEDPITEIQFPVTK